MKKILFLTITLLAVTSFGTAQVKMGGWRTHFSYNDITKISQSDNKIFAISAGSLFSINKKDGSLEFYSKLNGLNGTNISQIAYDKDNKVMIIAYIDGNIDFLSSNGIKNLPDFYSKQMSANKTIHHILIHDNTAYLSCNFGIITLNVKKMEIKDTYYIGENSAEVKVLNTTIYNGKIYAVSKNNIYSADVFNPQIINYEFWTKMTGLPGSGNIQSLQSFGSKLMLLRNNKLYAFENNQWEMVDNSTSYQKIKSIDPYLFGFTENNAYYFNKTLSQKNTIQNLTHLNDALIDSRSNQMWLSGDERGIAKYQTENSIFYKPKGPAVNIPYSMKFSGEKLFIVQGGRWTSQFLREGIVMMFENDQWTNISNQEIVSKTGKIAGDFMDIAIDPTDNKHFWVSSYANGVFEFKNNQFDKWHNFTNSTIETIFPNSYEYMRVDGGTYDSDGNVWFSNTSASKSIKYCKADGTWGELNHNSIKDLATLGKILIGKKNPNQKWILSVRHKPGVIIINDNGTPLNDNDDQVVFKTILKYKVNDEIRAFAPTYYYCIAEDNNGTMWVGTNEGPIVFHNIDEVTNDHYLCSRIIIPRNDGTSTGDFLLEKEKIKAIAIDGANRKWIGTESSGLYLLSEDGKETIHHFTTENSPLTSNKILSLAINPVTGEVFIGTGKGLISYQSDAAQSSNSFDNLHIYPNPIRENYDGLITIAGLMENSLVKIMDIAGNLIAELKSNGSLAIWDGNNKYGQKVSTGVYLAICTSEDGTKSATKKILIIN